MFWPTSGISGQKNNNVRIVKVESVDRPDEPKLPPPKDPSVEESAAPASEQSEEAEEEDRGIQESEEEQEEAEEPEPEPEEASNWGDDSCRVDKGNEWDICELECPTTDFGDQGNLISMIFFEKVIVNKNDLDHDGFVTQHEQAESINNPEEALGHFAAWASRCRPTDPNDRNWRKVTCSPEDKKDVENFETSWHMYTIGIGLWAKVKRADFLAGFAEILNKAHGSDTDYADTRDISCLITAGINLRNKWIADREGDNHKFADPRYYFKYSQSQMEQWKVPLRGKVHKNCITGYNIQNKWECEDPAPDFELNDDQFDIGRLSCPKQNWFPRHRLLAFHLFERMQVIAIDSGDGSGNGASDGKQGQSEIVKYQTKFKNFPEDKAGEMAITLICGQYKHPRFKLLFPELSAQSSCNKDDVIADKIQLTWRIYSIMRNQFARFDFDTAKQGLIDLMIRHFDRPEDMTGFLQGFQNNTHMVPQIHFCCIIQIGMQHGREMQWLHPTEQPDSEYYKQVRALQQYWKIEPEVWLKSIWLGELMVNEFFQDIK